MTWQVASDGQVHPPHCQPVRPTTFREAKQSYAGLLLDRKSGQPKNGVRKEEARNFNQPVCYVIYYILTTHHMHKPNLLLRLNVVSASNLTWHIVCRLNRWRSQHIHNAYSGLWVQYGLAYTMKVQLQTLVLAGAKYLPLFKTSKHKLGTKCLLTYWQPGQCSQYEVLWLDYGLKTSRIIHLSN